MTAGRNDPCPCGSGKKYKKCHGREPTIAPPPSPEAARARALKALDADLADRLQQFARKRHGRGWIEHLFDVHMGEEGAEIPEAELQLAIPWGLHVMRPVTGGLTLAEEFRLAQGGRAADDLNLLLDAYWSTWLSIWEVAAVERGVGTHLTDLLTGAERFVHDVRSSSTLQRFDTLLAFVLDCDGVSFFGGAHGQPLPPSNADRVVRAVRKLCHVRTRPVAMKRLRDQDLQLEIIDEWRFAVDDLLHAPPPTMTNTDGDPIALTTDDFELLAPRDEVAKRLESLGGAEPPDTEGEELVFAITKPGNATHRDWDNTIVARVALGRARLRVDTNSLRRADSMRAAIEAHLGGMVRFLLRSEANMRELFQQVQAQAAGSVPHRQPAESSPELAAIARDFRERHMTRWLDESIPALGGLTPREAARTPRARTQLELLLKEIEQSEDRLPPAERIDIGRLWTELGFSDRVGKRVD